MKVIIEIECETLAEFVSHLIEMSRQAKAEVKRLGVKPEEVEILPDDFDIDDNNCYGTHEITYSR